MPSSPADPRHGEAEPLDLVLRAVARAYDEALVAAAADDLDGCARLLTAADLLLAAPSAPAAGGVSLEQLRDDARAAHARLTAVLRELHHDTGEELGRARNGRKALAGYAGSRSLGDRIESRI